MQIFQLAISYFQISVRTERSWVQYKYRPTQLCLSQTEVRCNRCFHVFPSPAGPVKTWCGATCWRKIRLIPEMSTWWRNILICSPKWGQFFWIGSWRCVLQFFFLNQSTCIWKVIEETLVVLSSVKCQWVGYIIRAGLQSEAGRTFNRAESRSTGDRSLNYMFKRPFKQDPEPKMAPGVLQFQCELKGMYNWKEAHLTGTGVGAHGVGFKVWFWMCTQV